MPIANYTTAVPVSRTIGEVSGFLVQAGAQALMIEYENQLPSALSFRIYRAEQQIAFKLPCDWKATLTIMKRDPKVPRRCETAEQAQRIAWRVMRDWLRAQLALIEIGAVKLEQVMLPYLVTPSGETLYERLQQRGFAGLAIEDKRGSAC